jgi:hypothetical protein
MTKITEDVQLKIINYFKDNFENLPEKGFLAGQSVASLIFKFLDIPLPVVINDVDVFQIVDNETKAIILTPCDTRNIDPNIGTVQDNYNGKEYTCNGSGRGYKVIRSLNDPINPLINIIKIDSYNHDGYSTNEIHHKLMLNSFDFNCVSVGFDLETEEFFFTDAFLLFLDDLTLRVQSTHTPFHTLIRLNKKIKALTGINVNLEEERKLLVSRITSERKNGNTIVTGIKFWESFEEHIDDIRDWFTFSDYYTENQKVYKCISLSAKALSDLKIEESFNNKDLEVDHDFKYSFNATQFVHFYHLNSNTNLFTDNYKKNVMQFITQDNPFFAALYFKFVSREPLTYLSFLELKNIKSITKLFNEDNNFHSEVKNYKDLAELELIADKLEKIYNLNPKLINLILDSNGYTIEKILSFQEKEEKDIILEFKEKFSKNTTTKSSNNLKSIYLPDFTPNKSFTEKDLININNSENKTIKYNFVNSIDSLFDIYMNEDLSVHHFFLLLNKLNQGAYIYQCNKNKTFLAYFTNEKNQKITKYIIVQCEEHEPIGLRYLNNLNPADINLLNSELGEEFIFYLFLIKKYIELNNNSLEALLYAQRKFINPLSEGKEREHFKQVEGKEDYISQFDKNIPF